MTARDIFEAVLTEVSKTGAPSLLLLDFNYFFNKAIGLYINKLYNIYDINLLTTDSLRVLKATATLPVYPAIEKKELKGDWANIKTNLLLSEFTVGDTNLFGATYEVELPNDYLHMLNCICIYELQSDFKCYNSGNYIPFAAKRLTADTWSAIINDYYQRPLPERPYYYIHNLNQQNELPTDLYENGSGTDLAKGHTFEDTVTLKGLNESISLRDDTATYIRHSNPSKVRCEIRYGYDDSVFKLVAVLVDYVKSPLRIRLTQELVNKTKDESQIMEFPDYVCNEIINELVALVMENSADPRLLTHIPVTQSIANPAQQLTQSKPLNSKD